MLVLNQSERAVKLGRVVIPPKKHGDVPESILWQGKAQALRRQGVIKFPFDPNAKAAPAVDKKVVLEVSDKVKTADKVEAISSPPPVEEAAPGVRRRKFRESKE